MGPVDAIYSLWEDDNLLWGSPIVRGSEAYVDIYVEGRGTFRLYWGVPNPAVDPTIDQYVDTDISYYGDFCYVVFKDWYIGDYNRMPTYKFVVQKSPIYSWSDKEVIDALDYNGAHAIYYLLLEHLEIPAGDIGTDSFSDVAEALYGEGHGISLLMDVQTAAQTYIDSVLKHIDGVLQQDLDGKWKLKLIRADQAIAALPVITEEQMLDKPKFSRKTWQDTFNDIKVQYYKRTVESAWTEFEFIVFMNAHVGMDYNVSGVFMATEMLQPKQVTVSGEYTGAVGAIFATQTQAVTPPAQWRTLGIVQSDYGVSCSAVGVTSLAKGTKRAYTVFDLHSLDDNKVAWACNSMNDERIMGPLSMTYFTFGDQTSGDPDPYQADLYKDGWGFILDVRYDPTWTYAELVVWRTTDYGVTWNPNAIYTLYRSFLEAEQVAGVIDKTNGYGYIAVQQDEAGDNDAYLDIYRSTDRGASWQKIHSVFITDVDMTWPSITISAKGNELSVFLYWGGYPTNYVSTDGGSTWSKKQTLPLKPPSGGAWEWLNTCCLANGANMVFVGSWLPTMDWGQDGATMWDLYYYVSSDRGSTWTLLKKEDLHSGYGAYVDLHNCDEYFVLSHHGRAELDPYVEGVSGSPTSGMGAISFETTGRLSFALSKDNGMTWTEHRSIIPANYFNQAVKIFKCSLGE